MYFIGIDLGTSAVKLLLVDERGRVVHSVSREYPLFFPQPGWSQQDPEDWYQQTVAGLAALLEGFDARKVEGISFGGQMHGLVLLDEEDCVIRPAILWNDGRAIQENDFLNEEIGRSRLASYTANISFTGFTAPKLLWVKKHEPENFARIAKIMLPKDYLAYRLTGVFCTDVSDASGTLLFDVKNRRWSQEMCDVCGVKGQQLPTVFESSQTVGTLLPELARKLGLGSNVRVAAGAGDNAAAAVGTGAVGQGRCNISLGTSGTVFISSERFVADPAHALHAFAHADGQYHLMGCILSAASCNQWWLKDVLGSGDYEAQQKQVRREALGENRVFFLPYLMGERSPHNDPLARGAFVGMSLDTTQADMGQAVLEGVAFALRDCLEVARGQEITVDRTMICGGGAKNRLWREMIADILQLEVDVPAVEEGPGYGAAMLAMTACGVFPSVQEASLALIRVKERIEPEPAILEKYEGRYREFTEIYPAMKGLFARLHRA